MSVHITSQAWKVDGLTVAQKIVLVKLADNANDQGNCWPSIQTIAKECSCTERTVFNCLIVLEKIGHIHRESRRGTSSLYRVHPCNDFTPETISPLKPFHPTPETISGVPLKPFHPTPETISPRTIKNRKGNRKRTIKEEPDAEIPLPFDSPEFESAWNNWIEHKAEIRQPMPSTTIKAQFSKMKRWGEAAAIEAIENSIAGRWQGIFEPKDKPGGSRSKSPTRGIQESLQIPEIQIQ